MLSVILPAFNEEKSIIKSAERISAVLTDAGIKFELIYVDDGSCDNTWQEIKKLEADNSLRGRIRGIHFSRNFGKESAMFAGLKKAKGDVVTVLDVDMQHPPEKIPDMYKLWEEGYEVVEGVKADRGKESASHGIAARLFYYVIGKSAGVDMADASDFKLLDRKVVDTLNSLEERSAFFRALSYWAGYKRIKVEYEVGERFEGKSKWSKSMLFKYAIKNIVAFSAAPLHVVTWLGAVTLVVSVIMGLIALIQKITGTAAVGFTTVIILILFIGSILMISLGIIGIYIERIYDEVKGRPRYIISETCGDEGE